MEKNSIDNYSTIKWGGVMGYIFLPKCINPNAKIVERLEFELTYYEVVVQHFSHYVTCTFQGSHENFDKIRKKKEGKINQ